jgi:integrase
MDTMPRPRPPSLHRQVARNGAMIWYVRRGHGPRTRLKADYGTPQFWAAYDAAVRGDAPKTSSGRTSGGTLAWLFDLYRQTSAWTHLAASTRYKREKIMVRVLASAGSRTIAQVNEASIAAGVEKRAETPAAAQAFLDTLHAMFKWAIKAKLATIDPTTNVKVEAAPKRKGGYPPWTDDDMAKFEARWPRGTRERVMFDILTYTGLRIGDVAVLGRQHVRNGVIKIDNEKTGTRVEIPMLAALKTTIEAGPTGDLAFIVTRRGTPWRKDALGAEFVAAAKAAGVFGKSAHGIRKAAATRAAENGATERELEAIFGWKGGRMATHYTRSANRTRLAAGAISKLDRPEAEAETGTSIPSQGVDARDKNRIGE